MHSNMYIIQLVSTLQSGFSIRQLLMIYRYMLALPKAVAPTGSNNPLSDRTVHVSHQFQIVRRGQPKWCSKSNITLFLSHTHLRQFYLLEYILLRSSLYLQVYIRLKLDSHNIILPSSLSMFYTSSHLIYVSRSIL